MILLLGGTGYVGGAVQNNLIARGLPFVVASRRWNDYTSRDVLVKLLRDVRPEFLINAATDSQVAEPPRTPSSGLPATFSPCERAKGDGEQGWQAEAYPTHSRE